MDSEFLNYTKDMNVTLSKLQDAEKEYISDDIAARAISYINNMALKDAGDILLYCTALNVCNTYVKQQGSKIGYYFKSKVDNILEAIDIFDIQDISFDYQKDKGMSLLVIQIGEVQFSFHEVKLSIEINEMIQNSGKKKALAWDGIRKQHCAATTFMLAEANSLRTTEKTYRGKALLPKVERDIERMLSGELKFRVL